MKKLMIMAWVGAMGVAAIPLAAQETNLPATNSVSVADHQNPPLEQAGQADGIWTSRGIGEGFRSDAQDIGISLGAGIETRDIGGKVAHHVLLSRIEYGHMLGNEFGAGQWYGGNFEFVEEVFGGWQYYRTSRYLTGATTMLRYNFATGTHWMPFFDAGVGGTLTNIGHPDLGSLGEFNGQIGPGLSYFWRDNAVLTLQYRYLHMSSGGLSSPNQGVNENIAYVGVSWYF